MNWKGNGSSQPGVICGTIARIAWRELGKPRKFPWRIVGCRPRQVQDAYHIHVRSITFQADK